MSEKEDKSLRGEVRILPPRQAKPLKDSFFEGFFDEIKEVCQSSAPMENYKLPEIRHHNYNLSKRWYVEFYAWDVSKDRLVRKRLFEPINRKKTVSERLQVAEQIQSMVRRNLLNGKVLGKGQKIGVKQNIVRMTLLEALDFIIEQKTLAQNKKPYIRTFASLKNSLVEWMKFANEQDFPIKKLSTDKTFSFFQWIKGKGLANKTHNNLLGTFNTALNELQRYSPGLFKAGEFPLAVVVPLTVKSKRNAAFSTTQIQAILKEAKKRKFQLYILFVQFMYYTLARPSELLNLRVSDIDIESKQVFLRAEISKNKRDEYVGITPSLLEIILASGILKHDRSYYIFSIPVPGMQKVGGKYMYKRNKKILDELKINDRDYTLYSFKHSGAISLYQATKDIKVVQRQCRHTTINQTNEYLRDLNLLTDYDQLKDWKGAFG